MEQHAVIGAEIVRDMEFLATAREIIRHHHERWDGNGYPDKLSGIAIPIAARIFAVADSLDALTRPRPYREASTIPDARSVILQAAGTHFDPTVIDAFASIPDSVFEGVRTEIG